MKTTEEIEKLKASWHYDPVWDIETTEGFEDHEEELKAYRLECEAKWKTAQADRKRKVLFIADAFPTVESGYRHDGDPDGTFSSSGGLTKREIYAAMAMQGILANRNAKLDDVETSDSAVIHADALIAALNK